MILLYFLFAYSIGSVTSNYSGQNQSIPRAHPPDEALNLEAEFSYSFQPRHVHLAYGAQTTEIVVTWSTEESNGPSTVNWGTEMFNLENTTLGNSTFFEDATKTNVQYIHRVFLTDLTPDQTYFYQVGGYFGWSPVFGFKTVPERTSGLPLRFAAYGDLGVVNAKSLVRLQKEAHTGMYDLILHVGDMAYNMYENAGQTGDEFMKQIEPIAAYLPYMTCPGNHEHYGHFLQYRNRFSMPNYLETENIFYSFDVGLVHFVSVSTEVYYFGNTLDVIRQWQWLSKDLKEANMPENRAIRPWIILYGHRPMYCSNKDRDDCKYWNTRTRVGIRKGKSYWFGMEDLLMTNHVDIAIWGHEHSYERMWPMYNYTYYSQDEPYVNPKAPVHITSGSAGCREFIDHFETEPFSAKTASRYGYARYTVHNETHLDMQQIDSTNNEVVDEVTIVRHQGSWLEDY